MNTMVQNCLMTKNTRMDRSDGGKGNLEPKCVWRSAASGYATPVPQNATVRCYANRAVAREDDGGRHVIMFAAA